MPDFKRQAPISSMPQYETDIETLNYLRNSLMGVPFPMRRDINVGGFAAVEPGSRLSVPPSDDSEGIELWKLLQKDLAEGRIPAVVSPNEHGRVDDRLRLHERMHQAQALGGLTLSPEQWAKFRKANSIPLDDARAEGPVEGPAYEFQWMTNSYGPKEMKNFANYLNLVKSLHPNDAYALEAAFIPEARDAIHEYVANNPPPPPKPKLNMKELGLLDLLVGRK